jgi:hypothetical protein
MIYMFFSNWKTLLKDIRNNWRVAWRATVTMKALLLLSLSCSVIKGYWITGDYQCTTKSISTCRKQVFRGIAQQNLRCLEYCRRMERHPRDSPFHAWQRNFERFIDGLWYQSRLFGWCLDNKLFAAEGHKKPIRTHNYKYYVNRLQHWTHYVTKYNCEVFRRYSSYLRCYDDCRAKRLSWLSKYYSHYNRHFCESILTKCSLRKKCWLPKFTDRRIRKALHSCSGRSSKYLKVLKSTVQRLPTCFRKLMVRHSAIRQNVCTYLSFFLQRRSRRHLGVCKGNYLFKYSRRW